MSNLASSCESPALTDDVAPPPGAASLARPRVADPHIVVAGAAASGAAAGAGTRPSDLLDWAPSWAPLLIKWRWTLLVLWILLHAAAFNGQWRIGPDSSVFRSVARSVAAGEGYAILGQPQTQVYPGLPLMLAGVERLFGEAVWPAVLIILGMSAATLWFTYRLVRRIALPWVATVVTAGVAFNAVFFNHGHELLTDVPFLLGVMMALWGWETLTDRGWLRRLGSAGWLAGGLSLAAMMRPTFWVLAVAFGLVCVGGLLVALLPRFAPRAWTTGADRARSWRFYASCLAAVAVVGFAFAALDPRTRSLDLLAGGYEAEMAERVMSPLDRLRETPGKLWEMLEDHLEASFFAERAEGLNVVLAASLLAGVALVSRRRPLWGLLVAILLVALYFASSVPRYYLMVLPVLWLSWVMIVTKVGTWLFRSRGWSSAYVGFMVLFVIACNVGHDVKLIIEQRSRPFPRNYKDGVYEPIIAMADLINREVAPGETVIGPHAAEMTYLSRRRVLGRRELFTGRETSERQKAEKVRDSGAEWAVFPLIGYERKDLPLYRLGRAGIFVPSNQDDSTTLSAGAFNGEVWYLTRDWAIDETMIPPEDGPPPAVE